MHSIKTINFCLAALLVAAALLPRPAQAQPDTLPPLLESAKNAGANEFTVSSAALVALREANSAFVLPSLPSNSSPEL